MTTCCVPVRFVIIFLAFLAMLLIYALRVNMSVAIVAMSRISKTKDGKNYTYGECYVNDTRRNTATRDVDKDTGEFDWDEQDQGHVLASFSYMYVVTNILGGWAADKFGSKRVIAISLGGTAVLNLLTPLAARSSLGALIAVRVCEGFLEGPSFPAFSTLVSRWFPVSERGFSFSLIHSGSRFGAFVALSLTGVLSKSSFLEGWPSAFYCLGAAGVVLCIVWMFFMTETPSDHPLISASELNFILSGQGNEKPNTNPHIPWRCMLTSLAFWSVVITDFGEGWGFSTILNDLPSYMKYVLLYEIDKTGIISAVPFLLQVVSAWLSGFVCDLLLKKQYLSRTFIRKMATSIGLFVPALCLVGVIFSNCDRTLNLVFFAVGVGLTGVLTPGFRVSLMDMAPNYAGTLMGISNGIGNLSGFMAPLVVSQLTENNQTLYSWHIVFWISASIYILSGLLYLVFGTSAVQPWGVETPSSQANTFSSLDTSSKETVMSSENEENPIPLQTPILTRITYNSFDPILSRSAICPTNKKN